MNKYIIKAENTLRINRKKVVLLVGCFFLNLKLQQIV